MTQINLSDHIKDGKLKTKLDLKDNSVDLLYCSHIIETIPYNILIEKTLPEWYRVLKPGGILRISIIDYVNIVTQYKNSKASLQKVWETLFNTDIKDINSVSSPIVYDIASLKKVLGDAKFKGIKKWNAKNFKYNDRSSKTLNGRLISLNLQGEK